MIIRPWVRIELPSDYSTRLISREEAYARRVAYLFVVLGTSTVSSS